jgi:hypothetical protein
MRSEASWLLIAISIVSLAACSSGDPPGTTTPSDPDLVTVTGEVTHKDDQVPVDGGVTMKLKLDDGSTEALHFGSLFTHPPPSQEQLDLYQVIVQVDVGDRVTATGERSESGISLEELTILERH